MKHYSKTKNLLLREPLLSAYFTEPLWGSTCVGGERNTWISNIDKIAKPKAMTLQKGGKF